MTLLPSYTNNCIECGKCTKVCSFLNKYDINLKDYAEKLELAYNCFLCGECKRDCPVDIDGRKISVELRKNCIKQGYEPEKQEYKLLLLEKRNYIFKNYKHGKFKTILFPGCNFPAYYPKTTKLLSSMLMEKGIGTVFDCCGKPVEELGIEAKDLNSHFAKLGIEEIIILCPNCYYYLKEKVHVKITNIYVKLHELNMLRSMDLSDGLLYIPCPDRDSEEILSSITKNATNKIENIQCCGAGGCASFKEPEIARDLRGEFKDVNHKVYTYCATCSGVIAKSGIETEHVLNKLIGSNEKPAKGINSLINRALFKLR